MDEDEWWRAICPGDARSDWLIKADHWLAKQLIDHMDPDSKDVINFMSIDDVDYTSGRVLHVRITALYSVTSGEALRVEFAACDPLKKADRRALCHQHAQKPLRALAILVEEQRRQRAVDAAQEAALRLPVEARAD